MKHVDIMQFLTFNNVSDVLLFRHKTEKERIDIGIVG
jgi:hypothetical protein